MASNFNTIKQGGQGYEEKKQNDEIGDLKKSFAMLNHDLKKDGKTVVIAIGESGAKALCSLLGEKNQELTGDDCYLYWGGHQVCAVLYPLCGMNIPGTEEQYVYKSSRKIVDHISLPKASMPASHLPLKIALKGVIYRSMS